MSSSLSKQEVREILLRLAKNGLSHGQNFYDCISKGDADFVDQYSHDPTLKQRAKAEIRNSKILYHVKRLVLEDPESYEYFEDANSFYVRVATCLNVRFKKLDEHGRSSNGKTKRDLSFRLQESDRLPFANYGKLFVNMDVGYVLDPTGMVASVYFACCAPLNIGVHWKLPAKDLEIIETQTTLFAVEEAEIVPVLQLDLKEHLKKNPNERQSGSTI